METQLNTGKCLIGYWGMTLRENEEWGECV